jgi:hypothetical protein
MYEPQNNLDRKWAAAKIRKLRNETWGASGGIEVHLAINKAIMNIIRQDIQSRGMDLTKITLSNVKTYIDAAMHNYEEAATAVCPPLPCGADDHWIESNAQHTQEAREELLALLNWEHKQIRKGKHKPNLHAFDEQYFGED